MYRIFVGKSERRRPLKRTMEVKGDNIKVNFK
jgi:hypothetical protein